MRRRRRIRAVRAAWGAWRPPPQPAPLPTPPLPEPPVMTDKEITDALEHVDSPMVEAVVDSLIAGVRKMNRDGLPPVRAEPQAIRDYFRPYAIDLLIAAFASHAPTA